MVEFGISEAFDILGVRPGIKTTALKRAYRERAKECHPDNAINSGLDPEEAASRFIAVQMAYDVLKEKVELIDTLPGESGDADAQGSRFAWELTAAEVWGMGTQSEEQAMRDMVWFSLIWGADRWKWELDGAQRTKKGLPPKAAGVAFLLDALLPLLDEVTRRDLRIFRASIVKNQTEVNRLRDGRSRRHLLRDEWLTAKKMEGELAAFEARDLRRRFDQLTRCEGDITRDWDLEEYPLEWDTDLTRRLVAQRLYKQRQLEG